MGGAARVHPRRRGGGGHFIVHARKAILGLDTVKNRSAPRCGTSGCSRSCSTSRSCASVSTAASSRSTRRAPSWRRCSATLAVRVTLTLTLALALTLTLTLTLTRRPRVMLGRRARDEPYLFARAGELYGDMRGGPTRREVLRRYCDYAALPHPNANPNPNQVLRRYRDYAARAQQAGRVTPRPRRRRRARCSRLAPCPHPHLHPHPTLPHPTPLPHPNPHPHPHPHPRPTLTLTLPRPHPTPPQPGALLTPLGPLPRHALRQAVEPGAERDHAGARAAGQRAPTLTLTPNPNPNATSCRSARRAACPCPSWSRACRPRRWPTPCSTPGTSSS